MDPGLLAHAVPGRGPRCDQERRSGVAEPNVRSHELDTGESGVVPWLESLESIVALRGLGRNGTGGEEVKEVEEVEEVKERRCLCPVWCHTPVVL
jgi:hypothetical protein